MRKKILLILFMILFLVGCNTEFDLEEAVEQLDLTENESFTQKASSESEKNQDSEEAEILAAPLPTPPNGYRYTVLDYSVYVEKGGVIPGTDLTCRTAVVDISGLAENNTSEILYYPEVYLTAYNGDEFLHRFWMGGIYSTYVPPGGQTIFGKEKPGCSDISILEREGFDLESLDYQVEVYADPKPSNVSMQPFEDMEIISVSEKVRDYGITYDIVVRNTGDKKAYAELHFIAYDDLGEIIDVNFVFVQTDIEPWDALYPGTTAKVFLALPSETTDYKFFLLGTYNPEE